MYNIVQSIPPCLKYWKASFSHSGPSWLKNLYFAYLLSLKAIVKAEPYWRQYQFFSGDYQEDSETREQVSKIILAAK